MKKVTIYDVAREADVSLATVSRVINGSNVVRAKTRDRVLEVIKRLDFQPNEVARGLATSKSTTIAIVFPQSLFANVKEMIGGIGDTGRHLDYGINMYTTDDIGDEDTVKDVTERIIKSRVDGVILFNNDKTEEMIISLSKYSLPIVVIGEKISGENMGSIYIDVEQAASQIIDSYLVRGDKDIAYVSPRQNLIKNESVISGIKAAYKKHNLSFDEDKIIETTGDYLEDYQMLLKYFETNKHDFVLCGYDKDAVAVVKAASKNNILIPEDMNVIGMLNTTYALMCEPMLSSVNVPVYDMGAMAVRLLTKFLQGEEIESKEIAVKHTLIERESTD